MTRTSKGPKLDPKERDVRIIKVTSDGALGRMMADHAPQEQILKEAAKHVGQPKKTDIVVFDHTPWHVVNGRLRPHPQVHLEDNETIFKISFKQQERPCWWSEQEFRITRIEPSHHSPAVSGGADYPFATGRPPLPGQPELDHDGQPIFVARCPPIVAAAVGQTYKIHFFMGEDIDPDMEGTP
jgi:hypothetical protein